MKTIKENLLKIRLRMVAGFLVNRAGRFLLVIVFYFIWGMIYIKSMVDFNLCLNINYHKYLCK